MSNLNQREPTTTTEQSTPQEHDEYETYLMVSAKQSIPLELTRIIKEQVEVVVPVLESAELYTLKSLCDPEVWVGLTRRQKIVAGACMSYLVKTGGLPLICEDRDTENAKRYRLR